MIKIYYRGSCGSSRRAFSWFEKYDIHVEKKRVSRLDKKELIQLLSFSNEGLKEILKSSDRSGKAVQKSLDHIMGLSFNESLDFLIAHPDIFQTPIIMGDNKLLIGYNEDEIRQFLPKEYRRRRL
ncbi:ArsC/Spx/MgsR family protein [Lactococcus muris]|uniref:ArsC/Spx/MgsR family protein n=1 Tax=Lactococcus muris TaxID=2941330 RepID=A0ABV4DB79_9LACT|nr:ArsC/Spx/MgsR family protein [Lactococcus ileimucosae]